MSSMADRRRLHQEALSVTRDGADSEGRRDPRVLAVGACVVSPNEQGRLIDEAALKAIADGLEAPEDRPSPDDVSSAVHVAGWSDSSSSGTGHVLLDLTRYLGDYTGTASPMLPVQERGPRRVWSGDGIADDIFRGAMLPEADAFVDDLMWRVARMGWPSNPAPNPYVAAVSGGGVASSSSDREVDGDAEEDAVDLVDLPPLLEEVD